MLSFKQAPDYEIPSDFNGDNIYNVEVEVSDGDGGITTGLVNVTVRDVSDFDASYDLAGVISGTTTNLSGFVLAGIDEQDFSGFSVSGAGDINGDGIDDLIIGALAAR